MFPSKFSPVFSGEQCPTEMVLPTSNACSKTCTLFVLGYYRRVLCHNTSLCILVLLMSGLLTMYETTQIRE